MLNLSREAVEVELQAEVSPWNWDERSLHFHAHWRPDDVLPGTPFRDWNFIDIRGQGVFVGDAWTVLNPQGSWWGEGDEKIYVDGAWEKGFLTHFGTGTEDYYGWAGGEVPTRRDEFSAQPAVKRIDLGQHSPVDNRFVLRCAPLGIPSHGDPFAKTFLTASR